MRKKHIKPVSTFALLSAVIFTLFFAACASQSTQMPQNENGSFVYVPDTGFVQKADMAVRSAKIEKANDYAPKDYGMAKEKLDVSKDMFTLDDRQQSLILAEQSDIDARVAAAKTEGVKLDSQVKAMRSHVDALQQQVDQNR